jgi:hypothetical protein
MSAGPKTALNPQYGCAAVHDAAWHEGLAIGQTCVFEGRVPAVTRPSFFGDLMREHDDDEGIRKRLRRTNTLIVGLIVACVVALIALVIVWPPMNAPSGTAPTGTGGGATQAMRSVPIPQSALSQSQPAFIRRAARRSEIAW